MEYKIDNTFPVRLDGQEAMMIVLALRDKAESCRTDPVGRMYLVLAARVEAAKLAFHHRTYAAMAPRYGLPQK